MWSQESDDDLHFLHHDFYFLLADEADEEVKESEKARGLSDEEKKEVPSQIINNLDKGFSVLANFVSDEVKK